MYKRVENVFVYTAVLLLSLKTCTSDIYPPTLSLYSPGDLEYTDVVVRRVHDNLTLVCEVRGDAAERGFVWNFVSNGTEGRPFTVTPLGLTNSSRLEKFDLQESDSGSYLCSSPPYSVTKYILVQPWGNRCARGALSCGARCVLAAYVCDGRADCLRAEDEAPAFCPRAPCRGPDRLNCSSGRCIPSRACCAGAAPLCRQPACCSEHAPHRLGDSDEEMEYPFLIEDRHAPDDYGFIQSTIYTVTACALIFMIAVVLLVSALCKMHMKRAALRGYAHAHRDTAHHYSARFPPRYESTRLLDLPSFSPTRQNPQCESESAVSSPGEALPAGSGFALSRISSMFCTRYSQVPTSCEVEMTDVRPTSLTTSPTHPPLDYRSPIPSDFYNPEYIPTPTSQDYPTPNGPELNYMATPSDNYMPSPTSARDLNYMATPVEFFRRRNLRRNTIDRVIDHLTTPRPLTLQLGRFQFSIPRFRQPRPDTPDIAEININNLDFVRHSNDTYTLNGRTIRLLGADFENYPTLDGNRPPPYNEAMRYKQYGPPPEYLSREGINRENEATNNVEMPPRYDDLNGNTSSNGNSSRDGNTGNIATGSGIGNTSSSTGNTFTGTTNTGNTNTSDTNTGNTNISNTNNDDINNGNAPSTSNINIENTGNSPVPESISSVIDNLPAIDSDVNANDCVYNETVVANH